MIFDRIAHPMVAIGATCSIMVLFANACSAQSSDKLACSAPNVVSAVEALFLKELTSGSNEAVEQIFDPRHTTMSLEAIRTVKSEPRRSLCQASLRVKLAYAANPLGKAIENAMKKEGDEAQEERYQVQLTDDGETYVTIIDPRRKVNDAGSPTFDEDAGE